MTPKYQTPSLAAFFSDVEATSTVPPASLSQIPESSHPAPPRREPSSSRAYVCQSPEGPKQSKHLLNTSYPHSLEPSLVLLVHLNLVFHAQNLLTQHGNPGPFCNAPLTGWAQTQPVLFQPQAAKRLRIEIEAQFGAALQQLDVELVGGEVDGGGDWEGERGSLAGGGSGDVHGGSRRWWSS